MSVISQLGQSDIEGAGNSCGTLSNTREFDRFQLTMTNVQDRLVDEDNTGAEGIKMTLSSTNRALDSLCTAAGLELSRHDNFLDANQVIEQRGQDVIQLAFHLWLELITILG